MEDKLNLEAFSGFAEEVPFNEPEDFFGFISSQRLRSSRWAFRGQRNANWPLQTSLEFFAAQMAQPRMAEAIEGRDFREFRRRAAHYTDTLPKDDQNLVEWLALMRHHGSPSRLLDFSKSPYVAAFFATAEAQRDDSVAIWAIDARRLKYLSAMALTGETCIDYVQIGRNCAENPAFALINPAVFSSLVGGLNSHGLVPRTGPIAEVIFPIEPRLITERMLLQQGLFLFPTSLERGFQGCLSSVLARTRRWIESGVPRERVTQNVGGVRVSGMYIPEDRPLIYKLVLTADAHPHVLRELDRMGLNYASLTPGLDGLARSLTTVSRIRANCLPPGHGPDLDYGSDGY